MKAALHLVIYSDLDGTLLDHDRYEWTPAKPALDRLRELCVPLVLSSSKTRAEIERWRERLRNRDPFICENGGALYIPDGAISTPPRGSAREGGYRRIEYGAPHDELRKVLRRIAKRVDLPLRGFSSLPRPELEELTGLSGEDLDLSLRREYDEPFVSSRPLDGEEEARLKAEVRARGSHHPRRPLLPPHRRQQQGARRTGPDRRLRERVGLRHDRGAGGRTQ
jgi:mannosyl-3-phosphoglycerate phosphatase